MFNFLKIRSRRSAVTRGRRLIGTGHKVLSAQLYIRRPRCYDWPRFDNSHLDAHDFYNSNFFDNSSSSGVGAWGDPANDYQISTGGLKDIVLAYPSPHHIRRNFTVLPFTLPNALNLFPGDPLAPPLPGDLMINTTFTKEDVDYMVDNFQGDFIGFQAYMESAVSSTSPPLFPAILTHPYRTACIPACISSSPGEHFVASGPLPLLAFVTDELPKGPEWFLPQRCCPPGMLWGTNVVFERSPVFHAPCGSCYFYRSFHSISPTVAAQMIDKVWYDWQNKDPRNKYAYGGGSVTAVPSYLNYTIFPTGLPPYLNVSVSPDLKRIFLSHTPPSLIVRSPVTVYGTTLQFGI